MAHVEPSHSNCGAATWTCVQANGDGKNNSGISIDQLIAKTIGKTTPLPSLQVGLSTLDSYTDGLPGQHSRSMAWKSATEPLYKLVNPQAVFDRLTGQTAAATGDPTADAAALKRRALRLSVLDYVKDNTSALQRKLGTSDRRRLDQYLTSVRSLEQRVSAPSMQLSAAKCAQPARPSAVYSVGNVPEDYSREVHAGLMIDLVVMALACDITRVVSFMLDDARSDFVYNFTKLRKFTDTGSTEATGTIGSYHGAQHAGDRNDSFATIGYWNSQKAAQLAGKLAALSDGDAGNMLDNTVITYASGMHGGNHDPADLPVALIGGGGKSGAGTVLKTDRNIVFPQEQRLANVHFTLMKRVFECPEMSFGSSSGEIAEMTRG
jgi:ribosomal protein S15P/S13E